mmetsp:Transcript_53334/g.172142  ORF Transcript_53334/g.172142 Transcript_53334/m.172142 type:complete len:309 (-) Transcript_53334:1-927(-)
MISCPGHSCLFPWRDSSKRSSDRQKASLGRSWRRGSLGTSPSASSSSAVPFSSATSPPRNSSKRDSQPVSRAALSAGGRGVLLISAFQSSASASASRSAALPFFGDEEWAPSLPGNVLAKPVGEGWAIGDAPVHVRAPPFGLCRKLCAPCVRELPGTASRRRMGDNVTAPAAPNEPMSVPPRLPPPPPAEGEAEVFGLVSLKLAVKSPPSMLCKVGADAEPDTNLGRVLSAGVVNARAFEGISVAQRSVPILVFSRTARAGRHVSPRKRVGERLESESIQKPSMAAHGRTPRRLCEGYLPAGSSLDMP